MLNNLLKNSIQLNINDISNYNFPLNEPFCLEIEHNNIKYNFLIKISSTNNNLLCFGSGAHARNSKTKEGKLIKPPYFDRWSWYNHFDESFIAYSDPTFYYDEEITIGWFVGGEEWYLETIGNIINKIAKNRKIPNNNILFFGSSGGGFASIGLATLIKDSKAVVNNSIFSIYDLSEAHYNNLLKVLKTNFPNLTEDEIIKKLNYRIDLIELFKNKNYTPYITYYINTYSKGDLNRAKLFSEKILKLPFLSNLDIHYYHEYNQHDGHGPLETGKTIKILHLFNRVNLYNEEGKEKDFNIEKILQENKKIKKQLQKIKKENKQLKNTKSWKITKPLRKIRKLLK